MQALRQTLVCSSALAFVLVASLSASAESDWQKSYPVSAKPSLQVTTGDASLDVHGCAGCNEVRIRVEWNDRHPGDFNLSESQTGTQISLELKEKAALGFHMQFGSRREPRVTVETPANLDLEARTSDGALKVYDVRGVLVLHSGDGAVDIENTGGALRLAASDGAIRIHNVTGTLESRSSDGHVQIDGKFTSVQVHTSDGALDFTFDEGSQLTGSSRIEASDGRVTVRIPRALSADLDVHTGDGKIDCQLPVTMNGYNSSDSSGHNFRGHLNAGGPPLTIHTSDGNVTIAAL